jgi:hypothetical protein
MTKAKPSLMEGLAADDTDNGSGAEGIDSSAAWTTLYERFISGDPDQKKDAFKGMMALCEEESEGEPVTANTKPALMIHLGGK